MTDKVQRPQAFEIACDGYHDTYEAYDKAEADALYAKLETELRDTRNELAELRASVGEKPEDAWKRGVSAGIQLALDEIVDEPNPKAQELITCIKENISGLNDVIPLYVAPTLHTEKES